MLYTLLQRQPVIDAVQRDLRIITALQGGVRGEMSRIHDELNLAATMQRESLPKAMPRLNGVEFGVIFRPAAYVSGDIYDVEVIDDERVGFFVADAVGHGVPAALLTMIISRALSFHTHSPQEIEPARALGRLNDELVRTQHGKSRFATSVYGVLNTRTRELSIASAGHPSPLIFRDGATEEVKVEGPLLGIFEGEQYQQSTIPLEEGDTLLIYTDGFETAFPDADNEAWRPRQGTHNYFQRLAAQQWPSRVHRSPLDGALRELQRELDISAGSLHQVDDVTALAISLSAQTQRNPAYSAGAA
jgi:serine phosphatase RsbU (regulator of sigma subunit)